MLISPLKHTGFSVYSKSHLEGSSGQLKIPICRLIFKYLNALNTYSNGYNSVNHLISGQFSVPNKTIVAFVQISNSEVSGPSEKLIT